ncbi:sulfonate ABC transporter substrate-binding protein [Bradyrhizobium sp. AUGA SZCCT0182]|nr:sulfonate ABC transporter substrate-binding protein [Bradyrhizobium sp. AUGA SZCCT0182]
MSKITRRALGFATLAGLMLVSAAPSIAVAQEKVVRMGNQKVGAYALMKARGILEERLKPLGYTVTWKEFPSGPQLLEGVKAGVVDFAHSGDAPPIFAQAAGAPLLYIGHEPAAPKGEAIIVPKDSPIKTVADLKGKKIALNKGSNVHYLLVRALEKAGLKYTDVELVYLPPVGGRAAFEKGEVDAWVIWEPYRTSAEMSLGARTVADGTGLVSNYEFFFTSKTFAEAHPQIIEVVLGAARDVYAEAAKDIRGTAKTFSAAAGFPEPVMEVALSRRTFDILPISSSVIAEQQRIADTFKDLGLIPAAINVSDAARK